MGRWARRILKTLLAFAIVGYLAICIFMYVKQGEMIFHPTDDGERILALAAAPENEAFDLDRDGVILRGVLLLAPGEGPAPVLIYFGGNADSVSSKVEVFAYLRERGVHLLLVPYRGYDASGGEPTADDLRTDALAIYDKLTLHPRVDRGSIYTMGYSLGSGVATYLAHERELAGVILAAPYRRLSEIAANGYPWLPVETLIQHEFDSLSLAPEVEEPLLIVHGDADTLIPIAHGESLASVWKGGAKLVRLDGLGHHGVPSHAAVPGAIREFMGL
ncbi:MAG TPA: hypothetical protein ENJ18_19190 [Nannocystis exedens]|nr:hypothetical protein [Nannocystis exedens]